VAELREQLNEVCRGPQTTRAARRTASGLARSRQRPSLLSHVCKDRGFACTGSTLSVGSLGPRHVIWRTCTAGPVSRTGPTGRRWIAALGRLSFVPRLSTGHRMRRPTFFLSAVLTTLFMNAAALTAAWAATPAGPPDGATQRLELFSRAQRSCALLVLGSPEKGRAFAALHSKSLNALCECVAVYAVSQTSDDTMRAILAGDQGLTSSFIDLQLKAFGTCIG